MASSEKKEGSTLRPRKLERFYLYFCFGQLFNRVFCPERPLEAVEAAGAAGAPITPLVPLLAFVGI